MQHIIRIPSVQVPQTQQLINTYLGAHPKAKLASIHALPIQKIGGVDMDIIVAFEEKNK